MSRANLKYTLVAALAFTVLIYLFANTKADDQYVKARVLNDMRLAKQQDALLTEEVLELRYGLLTNYDPIVATSEALSSTTERLSRELRGQYRDGRQPGIDHALNTYLTALVAKQQVVEDFKTEDAVLKNSLAYLPTLSEEFTGPDDQDARSVDRLVRAVLFHNISTGTDAKSQIPVLVDRVAAAMQRYPPEKQADLKLLLIHAHLITVRRDSVDHLLASLVSAPTSALGDQLFQNYQEFSSQIEHRRSIWTVILDVFAGLLVLGIAGVLAVLNRNNRASLAEAIARADRDPLTGLLNHRAHHRRIAEEIDRADRTGTSVAIGLIDLDNFKFFNDAYGHAVGDDVLREIAGALVTACRTYDVLSRYGGDEFAFIMPAIGFDEAAAVVQRVKETLERTGYRPRGHDTTIPITISIGLALYPADGSCRQDVLAVADARLRQAKFAEGTDSKAEDLRLSVSRTIEGFPMLMALVAAVDNKDRYTRCHSEDVMTYSLQIAQRMGMDDEMLQQVQIAALLHDVGKIGIPDAILRKPDKLTDEEFEAIKQHPAMGAVIVGAIPGLEQTLGAVRHHHERWDGKGYPDGLTQKETPLMARLMAVADAYSAMTTDRPYRKGMSDEVALSILEKGAGTQWDPECVRAFLEVHPLWHVPDSALNQFHTIAAERHPREMLHKAA